MAGVSTVGAWRWCETRLKVATALGLRHPPKTSQKKSGQPGIARNQFGFCRFLLSNNTRTILRFSTSIPSSPTLVRASFF